MSEIFISHSTKDHVKAKELQEHLEAKGATTFLAPNSIAPGQKWSSEIISKLRESKVVLLLASKDASDSKYVNQEIGGALLLEKTFVPILCGIAPEELPGWAKEHQAVEMTEDRNAVSKALDSIAENLRTDRILKFLLFVGFLWIVFLFLKKKS